MTGKSDGDQGQEASEDAQADRRYTELLQELRVAQTGVQFLFAFLLTLAFTQRFAHITDLQKWLYLGTLLVSSLAAALLIGLVALVLRRTGADLPGAGWMSAAWASHVLLDYLGLDTSPPSGETALWPLSTRFYVSPVAVFYDVRRAFTPPAIEHNAIAVAIELVVLVPIALLCWRRRPVARP